MENLPASNASEPDMELAPETSKQPELIHKQDAPRENSMGMILLRRRFNYASRPRPNALAIVDPATNQVLYPGIAKIEKSPEKEFAVGDGDAKVSNVFQSHEQQQPLQQPQNFVEFPADQHTIVPDYQYPTFMMASFDPNNNDQTSFQHPIKYHDLPYMNEGRNQ